MAREGHVSQPSSLRFCRAWSHRDSTRVRGDASSNPPLNSGIRPAAHDTVFCKIYTYPEAPDKPQDRG